MNIETLFDQPAARSLPGMVVSLLLLLPDNATSQVLLPSPPLDKVEFAQVLQDLGPLANGLVAALSMDCPDNGSTVIINPSLGFSPMFEGPVEWVNDSGRQCANFADRGAILRVNFSLAGAYEPYTIAVWMKFPVASGYGVVVDGAMGPLLAVKDGSFFCGKDTSTEVFCNIRGIPSGWHHVAITSDPTRISFFFDGTLSGTLRKLLPLRDSIITAIGNSYKVKPNGARCGCLDDMFLYKRALTPQEIVALGKVRLPIHQPNGIPVPPPQPGVGDVAQGSPNAVADIRSYLNNLIVIGGRDGAFAGAGFVAKLANGNYLFTTAGTAAAAKDSSSIKTLAGAPMRLAAGSVAVGSDIFVAPAAGAGNGLEVMQDVGKEVSIGDAVVIFQRDTTTGAIDTTPGKIAIIAADKVNVDTGYALGIIGSPVIHLKTGKVIGFSPASGGSRLDSVKAWQPVSWDSLLAQAARLQQIAALTADLAKLEYELQEHRVPRGSYANLELRQAIQLYDRAARSRPNETDLASATADFVRSVKGIGQADLATTQRSFSCDYFQRELSELQSKRVEILKKIEAPTAVGR